MSIGCRYYEQSSFATMSGLGIFFASFAPKPPKITYICLASRRNLNTMQTRTSPLRTYHTALLAGACLWLLSSGFIVPPNKTSAVELTKLFLSEAQKIQTMSFVIEKRERIQSKMDVQINHVKYHRKPLKVYMRQESPQQGMEVLFVEGENNNKLLVNTNGFPWVSLSLDPYNNKVRQNQHHTIYESGYDYVAGVIGRYMEKYKAELSHIIVNDGTVVWDNRECHKVIINNPHFRYVDYTVQKGEDLNDIAKKLNLSEYMILEKNKLKDYDDVRAGQVIKVPEDYALKIILYLDKKTNLPLIIKVYDDLGLFEEYKYTKLQINPKFHPQEFTKSFGSYKF